MKKLPPGHVTLERALSKLGIASRTRAREWILAGKVRVNGAVKNNPGFAVVPERARIEVEGLAPAEGAARARMRTFLLYKPRGVVTTHADEKGRLTVFSLLQEEKLHLIAVGRLDWATSGLLLLTNDTRLSAWLTDPRNEVPRTYLVTVRGRLAEAELARVRGGIEDEGELLAPDEVTVRKESGKETHLIVRLTEGKNREIRRMFSALGHEVTKLKRVAFGTLELGELKPGEYRELTAEELRLAFPGAPLRA